jgi:hypothetical protein
MLAQPTFRRLLKAVNGEAKLLSHKDLVDTLYALSKYYPSVPSNILLNFTETIKEQVPSMKPIHIAYLCQALSRLDWKTSPVEESLRNAIKLFAEKNHSDFTAFELSKLCGYLVKVGDLGDELSLKIEESAIERVKEGRVEEMELWDWGGIIRYFTLRDGKEFLERVWDVKDRHLEAIKEEEGVLDVVADYVVYKVKEMEEVSLPFRIQDMTELVACYGKLRKFDKNKIFEDLSNKAAELIWYREDWKFKDMTKLSWALARYYTHKELPNFNADISSIIHPRHEYAKVKSTKHRNFEKIFGMINKRKENIDLEYLPITLYAMANIGYTDKEFFDGAILTLVPYAHSMLQPQDLGYWMQAMAMSGLTEYNDFFIDTLASILPKMQKNPQFELSLSQILSSIIQLEIDVSRIENFPFYIGKFVDILGAEITEDHIFTIAPLLWGLMGWKYYNERLFTRSLQLASQDISKLTKYDLILLNQVMNDLRGMDLLKKRDFYDLQRIAREQWLEYDNAQLISRLKEVEMHTGRNLIQIMKKLHSSLEGMDKIKLLVKNTDTGYVDFIEYDNKVLVPIDQLMKNNSTYSSTSPGENLAYKNNGFHKIRIRQMMQYHRSKGKEVALKEVDDIISDTIAEDKQEAKKKLYSSTV